MVLLAPGMGDAIQAAKAGILEIADVFVVNKADSPQAQETIRDLRNMIALADRAPEGDWKPPVVTTIATSGDGIDELVGKLDAHWSWLDGSGERDRRRAARAREEVAALALGALRGRLDFSQLDELASQVAEGTLDPFAAASELLAQSQG